MAVSPSPATALGDGRLEGGAADGERGMRLRHRDPPEPEPLPGLELPDAGDLVRAYRADLRVAAGGLPVHQQHDGLPVADHLDGPERDAVRNDVVSLRVLDARALEPCAHPIRLGQHLRRDGAERGDYR